MKKGVFNLPFPIKGMHTDSAISNQPLGTTRKCLNLMLYDRDSRARGGKRPGTIKKVYGSDSAVDHGGTITTLFQWGSAILSSGPNGLYVNGVLCTLGTAGSQPTNIQGITAIGTKAYILDTSVLYVLSGVTLDLAVESTHGLGGFYSSNAIPTGCTLLSSWRGRLVMAGGKNWYMSRAGTPLDFDFSVAKDISRAIESAGFSTQCPAQIGDPIISLMPFTKDTFVFGLDREVWRMNGDPGDQGQLEVVAPGEGVTGRDGWTIDPAGTMWILGTAGPYQFSGISLFPFRQEEITAYFSAINQGMVVYLAWDRDRVGLWIFTSQGALFYDQRDDGYWPQEFAQAIGPVLVYDGDAPDDRQILLGCSDGFVRILSNAAFTDDGSPINSSIWLGPLQPAGVNQRAKITQIQAILAEVYGLGQVEKVTPGTIQVGDIFTVAVTMGANTASVSFTATAATTVNVAEGLMAAIKAYPAPPFNSIIPTTAIDTGVTSLILTGPPGVLFTVTCSTINGGANDTQTLVHSTLGSATAPATVSTVDWTLQSGRDAWSAFMNPEQFTSGTFAGDNRQTTQAVRLSGNCFYLRLGNSSSVSVFGVEEIVVSASPAGRAR